MANVYLDRLDPEAVRILIEAGFDWQPAIPGFYHRWSERCVWYQTVRDSTLAELEALVGLARYDIDAREWVCEPRGHLRITIMNPTHLPPDARDRCEAHNTAARALLHAIQNRRSVTLRELRNVAGEFVARNQTTGETVTSVALKRARINPGIENSTSSVS